MALRREELRDGIIARLRQGVVIPAPPLVLRTARQLDERRQCALTRYYIDSGAGGLAIGVHTTQFEVCDVGLYEPALRLTAGTAKTWAAQSGIMITGLVGLTSEALGEAEVALALVYHAGLLDHWSVCVKPAVEFLARTHGTVAAGTVAPDLSQLDSQITNANGALFDVNNNFAGCIGGCHKFLRRQGLLQGTWCLNLDAAMRPGEAKEFDWVFGDYPHLCDDDLVPTNLERWVA